MTVASGTVPYQYKETHLINDQLFHFKTPSTQLHVSPSAVYTEEAMYVIKSEANRINAGGIVFGETILSLFDGFIKFVGPNTGSGIFDPDPDGKYLGGVLPVSMTTTEGVTYNSYTPASLNWKEYIVYMRQELHEIAATVANSVGGTNENEVLADYLNFYKGYNDGWAESGRFYLEESFGFIYHSSGIMTDGVMYDRYLDEVRYQPIPYLSGIVNSIGVETKSEMTMRPIKPQYWRTDSSLPPLWTDVEVYGDVFVPNTIVMFSGGGVDGIGTSQYHLGITEDHIGSGRLDGPNDAIPTMVDGWYTVVIGNSGTGDESGLFPWHSGLENFPRWARQPAADANMPGSGGNSWVTLITDDIFILQQNTDQTSAIESGVRWLHQYDPDESVASVDFYFTSHPASGVRKLWGNEFYAKVNSEKGTQDLYRPGQYIYDRTNDEIIRIGSSGFNNAHANYPFGTGLITRWNSDMSWVDQNFIGNLTTAGGEGFAVRGMETITDDGTNYICNGFIHNVAAGVAASGALIKMDRTATPSMTDAIVSGYIKGRIFYHRGQSEYLYLLHSGTLNRTLDERPTHESGTYMVASLTWGEFTGPNAGNMTLTHYQPTQSTRAQQIFNSGGYPLMRLLCLFNDETSDDLWGMVNAFPSGSESGSSDNISRYLVRFDDTAGHPYQMEDVWLIGSEQDSPSDLDTNMRGNANWSLFMDNYEY